MFRLTMLLVLVMGILLSGCVPTTITGSGNVVTRDEAITGFDKVAISHSFEVDVIQGEDFSVIIRLDDNLIEHLRVVKEGSTLKIGLNPNRNYTVRDATMEAEVIMPQLAGLDLSGSSHAMISGFKSVADLSTDLSASSSLQGDIEAGNINIDMASSSEMKLNGSGDDATIDVSSSSELDLSEFTVVNARVNATSSSSATVNVSGRLDVDASSSASVYYLGNPILGEIDTSSSASVEPK
ncbi:MAG: DUF2807 domain-containing protein [Anaerolineaceae bacterium]|nr:MAG: DUF2807 domain-containing protein [Anaerolineaceae bacterium]